MLNPHFPFSSAEAQAEFERRTADLGRTTRAAAKAMTKALTPAIRQCYTAVQPLLDWANSPEGRAALAAYETAGQLAACHCLCSHNHPDRALCLGEAPTSELTVIRYRTPDLGPQDVPMCPPCANATIRRPTQP
jgi:hypothetical protein